MEPYHTVLLLVSDLLPPNVLSVSLRRVNRAFHQRCVDSTVVSCSAWLPLWAVEEGVREAARRSNRRDKQDSVRRFWHSIVKSGDVDNLQLLAASGGSAWDRGVYEAAAAVGNVHVMDWARCSGCPHSHYIEDDLPEVESLHRFRAVCTSQAAAHGHIPVLQWLDRVGSLSVSHVCSHAAKSGQLHVVRWGRARSPPCPWDATTSTAAHAGNLALLQWLRRQGCPWDATVCSCAAAAGHRHIIQWARANGCPWDSGTCLAAGRHGHLALLEWARASGRPCVLDVRFATLMAVMGQLHVLQWARRQQPPCPWGAAVTSAAAAHHNMKLLRWAVDNSCPFSERTCAYIMAHELPAVCRCQPPGAPSATAVRALRWSLGRAESRQH